MPVVVTTKVPLTANTAALLMAADSSRGAAEIQNTTNVVVWISPTNPPTLGSPSWAVPPAIGGVPGVSVFEPMSYPQQDWYAISTGAGDVTVRWW